MIYLDFKDTAFSNFKKPKRARLVLVLIKELIKLNRRLREEDQEIVEINHRITFK